MIDFLHKNAPFSPLDIKKLNGYENENYLILSNKGKVVFKTYQYSKHELDLVEAQNEALVFLQKNGQKNIPSPLAFKDGRYVHISSFNGKKTICRMLSYIKGAFLGDLVHSEALFTSFGSFLAKMDVKLQTFHNHTIKARVFEWDLQHFHLNKKMIAAIPSAKDSSTILYFFQQFNENVLPILPHLRQSIIHNDANEWNVLIDDNNKIGIIDFGDLAYSQLINELAIAITYACYGKENPIDWACYIIKSYHKIIPLKAEEISILYYLIAARLCTSLCNAAHSKKENPANEYAYSGEKSAWALLYRLLEINPMAAENRFRSVLGWQV